MLYSYNNQQKYKKLLIFALVNQCIIACLHLYIILNSLLNVFEFIVLVLLIVQTFLVAFKIFLKKNYRLIMEYTFTSYLIIYFITIDMALQREFSMVYAYFMLFTVFTIVNLALRIITQEMVRLMSYLKVIVAYWIITVISWLINSYIFIVGFYNAMIIMLFLYPLIIYIVNRTRFQEYGGHIVKRHTIVVVVSIIMIVVQFVPGLSSFLVNNHDLYTYCIIILELINSILFIDFLNTNKQSIKYRYPLPLYALLVALLSAYIFIMREQPVLIMSSLYFYIIVQIAIKEYYMLDFVQGNPYDNESSHDMNLMLRRRINEYKSEEIIKEDMAAFLHDEVLQDLMLIKRELYDIQKVHVSDNLIANINRLIILVRDQMGVFKPDIGNAKSLYDSYVYLIHRIKTKYNRDDILIDFECDENLFLSSPYDLVIFRFLHELVTNIFKHSKGDYSRINLQVENGRIRLVIINYDDYLSVQKNQEAFGLKMIQREVDRFCGTITIENSALDGLNDESDPFLKTVIEIPIEGGRTYESFINR